MDDDQNSNGRFHYCNNEIKNQQLYTRKGQVSSALFKVKDKDKDYDNDD